MISRPAVIAVLALIEFVIVGLMVEAVHGGGSASGAPNSSAVFAAGPNLVEGGPARVFATGSNPTLTVDIGYADLTIQAGDTAQMQASVSKSEAFGIFRSTAPISARKDAENVRITAAATHGWSIGDDRRVTVLVPPETRVTVVNAGDIQVEGLRGETSLSSAGRGRVSVDDYNGPALRVESSGRISLTRVVSTRLDATSSDGRIVGTALAVRDGNIESSDGLVVLGFAAGADTLVTAETKDGSIHVSGVNATASVPTVRKSSSDDDDDDDSSSRTVRIGGGNGRLHVHADDGSIDITQES